MSSPSNIITHSSTETAILSLEKEKLEAYFADILALTEKVKELKKEYESAVGDTKHAYSLVYNDFLWKIQRQCGTLHFYVCGVDALNPFA
jgi:hypothetical protein